MFSFRFSSDPFRFFLSFPFIDSPDRGLGQGDSESQQKDETPSGVNLRRQSSLQYRDPQATMRRGDDIKLNVVF